MNQKKILKAKQSKTMSNQSYSTRRTSYVADPTGACYKRLLPPSTTSSSAIVPASTSSTSFYEFKKTNPEGAHRTGDEFLTPTTIEDYLRDTSSRHSPKMPFPDAANFNIDYKTPLPKTVEKLHEELNGSTLIYPVGDTEGIEVLTTAHHIPNPGGMDAVSNAISYGLFAILATYNPLRRVDPFNFLKDVSNETFTLFVHGVRTTSDRPSKATMYFVSDSPKVRLFVAQATHRIDPNIVELVHVPLPGTECVGACGTFEKTLECVNEQAYHTFCRTLRLPVREDTKAGIFAYMHTKFTSTPGMNNRICVVRQSTPVFPKCLPDSADFFGVVNTGFSEDNHPYLLTLFMLEYAFQPFLCFLVKGGDLTVSTIKSMDLPLLYTIELTGEFELLYKNPQNMTQRYYAEVVQTSSLFIQMLDKVFDKDITDNKCLAGFVCAYTEIQKKFEKLIEDAKKDKHIVYVGAQVEYKLPTGLLTTNTVTDIKNGKIELGRSAVIQADVVTKIDGKELANSLCDIDRLRQLFYIVTETFAKLVDSIAAFDAEYKRRAQNLHHPSPVHYLLCKLKQKVMPWIIYRHHTIESLYTGICACLRECPPCASNTLLLASDFCQKYLLEAELRSVLAHAFTDKSGEPNMDIIMQYASQHPSTREGALCRKFLEMTYMRKVKETMVASGSTQGEMQVAAQRLCALLREVREKKILNGANAANIQAFVMRAIDEWATTGGGQTDYHRKVVDHVEKRDPELQKEILSILDSMKDMYSRLMRVVFGLGIHPLIDVSLADNKDALDGLGALARLTKSPMQCVRAPDFGMCATVQEATSLLSKLKDRAVELPQQLTCLAALDTMYGDAFMRRDSTTGKETPYILMENGAKQRAHVPLPDLLRTLTQPAPVILFQAS